MWPYRYNLAIAFDEVAARHPDNIALKFPTGQSVTYRQLNERANRLSRFLLDTNVGRGDVVCISGRKTVDVFACMLACLKIGAAYSILDPESPAERLGKIVRSCLPKAVFTESALLRKLRGIGACPDANEITSDPGKLEKAIASYDPATPEETASVTGENPAYIMFTSGSTGFPKGAVMTHANVSNLISWSVETYGFSPGDILTNVNPLYFDNSVFDFYSSLFSGACMVPFSKQDVMDATKLVAAIDRLGCTSWFSVPTLLIFLQTMKVLNRDNMRSLKRIIFGGEGYPKASLKRLFDLYSHRIEFHNVYGPTECTCICSSYRLTPEDFEDSQGLPPLGRMANNFSYLILDEDNRRVRDNEVGELCLLGPNVGKGYYNDPERTRASFVQNPCNSQYSEIMYRTGDLVKYSSGDGKIHIIGRKDNQIKHMGYRIELEEIEAALSSLDYVSRAAALHGSRRGLSQIHAVVSCRTEMDERDIKRDLERIIPVYMIPSVFHLVKELPRNSNGKVDRRKLVQMYLSKNTGG